MTIIWGKKAYHDLAGIADYLAGLSSEAAENTIDRIQKTVLMLAEFPNMGTKVDETGLRRLVVSDTPYVIFYRVLPERVSIRAIFHTSQRRFLEYLAARLFASCFGFEKTPTTRITRKGRGGK